MKRVYLDFNCYINALKNENFKKLLLSKKNEVEYYYSFAHAEELHRNENNDEYSDKIDSVKAIVNLITDNKIVGTNGKDFVLSSFGFNSEYDRCKTYDTDQLVDGQGELNEKAVQILGLSEEDKNQIKGLSFNKIWEDERVISEINRFGIKRECPNYITAADYVPHLCSILGMVGYSIEKNTHTYVSGVYDSTHLIFATQMDYFLTSDKECFKKAQAIFYYLNSNCQAVLVPNPCESKFENVEKAINKIK